MTSAQGFFACRLLAGCAFWLHNVVAAPFLFRHSPPEARGSLFGAAEAVHTLAKVVGALLAGQLVGLLVERGAVSEPESMRWVLTSSAVLALCPPGSMRESTNRGGG